MTRKLSWTETLGNTPDEVAQNIFKMGVRGIRKNYRNCILVRVYKHLYPNGWSNIYVDYKKCKYANGKVFYTGIITFNDCQIMDPPCPSVLAEFMHKFDNGDYPFLEVEPLPKKQDVLSKLTVEEKIALGY